MTLPQSLEHFSTHFLECTGRAPRSFWEATAKRGKRAQDAREGEGECTARSASFHGEGEPGLVGCCGGVPEMEIFLDADPTNPERDSLKY